jgi:hypothetical protein
MKIHESVETFQQRIESMNQMADMKSQEERACKSKPVLNLVKNFLIKRKAVFYGGMAQNEYLPKDMKFYKSSDIPDYDVFSSTPEKLATDLADELMDKGYTFVTVKHAMHEGTYKVSWDFEDVADITKVSKSQEASMRRRAKKRSDGLLLCPLHLLKANAYLELAMPKSSMFRWAKVFERLQLLEEAYPIKRDEVQWKISKDDALNELVSKCFAFLKRKALPLTGNPAIQYYILNTFKKNRYLEWCPRLEALTLNGEETLTSLKKMLDRSKRRYRVVESGAKEDTDRIADREWTILDTDTACPILRLKEVVNRCYSVQRASNGVLYASIFLIITLTYRDLQTFPKLQQIEHVVSGMIDNIRVDDFRVECFGSVRDMLSIKRSKIRKKMPAIFYDPERSK